MSDLDLAKEPSEPAKVKVIALWPSLTFVEGATAHSIAKVKAIPNNSHTHPPKVAHSIATISPSVNRLALARPIHPPKVQYFLVIFKPI